jgi:hypothetical protein
VSTHGRRVCGVPHREYSEYPSAGAPAPPPPTVAGVDDTSAPPHGDTAAHTAGVSCAFRAARTVSSRCTPTPSHERPRFCLRTCTLRPCDAGSPDAKPSRPAAHTNGTGPPQPDEVASQTGSAPCGASGDSACRHERWSVTSARRPLRRAMLWWLFLPAHTPLHNRHLWTLGRMRTKARFPLRPSLTEARFPVGPLLFALVRSLVGGFPLRPIPALADSRLGRFPLRPIPA